MAYRWFYEEPLILKMFFKKWICVPYAILIHAEIIAYYYAVVDMVYYFT